MSRTIDILGDQGETEVQSRLSKEGLKCVKPVPDYTGSDIDLLWPIESTSGEHIAESLDKALKPRTAKLQVKATNGATKVTAKLSSILKLVQSNEPAFLVAVQFDFKNEMIATFWFHIDERWIAHVLKRLRNCTAKNKKPSDSKIIFNFTKGVSIDPAKRGIRDYLEKEIGINLDLYAENKIEHRRNCGYDEFRHEMEVSLFAADFNGLVDGLMGRKPLSVASAEHFETRFGIKLQTAPPFGIGDLKSIQLSPPKEDSWTLTTIKDAQESISLVGDVISSHLIPLPEGEHQFEWSTELTTLIFSNSYINCTVDTQAIYTAAQFPSDVIENLQFAQDIVSGDYSLNISSKVGVKDATISGLLPQEPTITFDANYWMDLASAVEHIWQETGVEPYQIFHNDLDAEMIHSAAKMLDLSDREELMGGHVRFERNPNLNDEMYEGIDTLGYVVNFKIGNEVFAVASIFDVHKETDGDDVILTTKSQKSGMGIRLRSGREEQDLQNFFDRFRERHQASVWAFMKLGEDSGEIEITGG